MGDLTAEQVMANADAVARMDVDGKESLKVPSLPMVYVKVDGEWMVSHPAVSNSKQKGQLKARTELTLRKLNQKDRLRAELERRRAGKK